mgnify:CR=1 FL=1
MVIYAVWKELSLKGGYIGQAKNGTANECDRIFDHIISIQTGPDSCGKFIQKYGIGGCRYGYWDESDGFGVQEQWNGFVKSLGLTNTTVEDNMHFAEIMHILGNKIDLSEQNLAIGGGGWHINLAQSAPIKALLNHDYIQSVWKFLDDSQKKGEVVFVDFSDLLRTTNIEQKFYYPQAYLGCRIIARATPWYVIQNLDLGSILIEIIKGQLTENGLKTLLKTQINQVSNVLINVFNSKSADIQITNNMKNILFQTDWYGKLAKELYKRFSWFENKLKKPISFEALVKGFARSTGGTLIPIVNIVRQQSLNALTSLKAPKWFNPPQGIPIKRYTEENGKFIIKAARQLFNTAAKACATLKPTDDLYGRMLNYYQETYQFNSQSSTITQWQTGYRYLASIYVGPDAFIEEYDEEDNQLLYFTSKKTGIEYFPSDRHGGWGWWYNDYRTWCHRSDADIPFWTI